jgi:hypothetical protein
MTEGVAVAVFVSELALYPYRTHERVSLSWMGAPGEDQETTISPGMPVVVRWMGGTVASAAVSTRSSIATS